MSIAVDDFDMLDSWDRASQIDMDYDGFLEVIYRLREGTDQHAERLDWLELDSGTWANTVSFETEHEAYGAVRDFVESSVRTHAGTSGWLYREINEVTPENELTQLHRLHVALKAEEDSLLTQLQEYARNVNPTDPNRIPESARNLLFIDVPLRNLGIPQKNKRNS